MTNAVNSETETDRLLGMPASEATPYRRLVEHVLGLEDICSYVARRMKDGLSRRAVARELTDRINAPDVEISDVLLIRWCEPERLAESGRSRATEKRAPEPTEEDE